MRRLRVLDTTYKPDGILVQLSFGGLWVKFDIVAFAFDETVWGSRWMRVVLPDILPR